MHTTSCMHAHTHKDHPAPQVLQNKIQRFFLGVHTYTPLPALHTEMDWLEMRSLRWLEVVRLFNRIVCMERTKLSRRILEWDYKGNAKGWLSDMLTICTETGIPIPDEIRFVYDLDPVKRKLMMKNRQEWKDATEKTRYQAPVVSLKVNLYQLANLSEVTYFHIGA